MNFQIDKSLVEICLSKVTRTDEFKLRGLLNRYMRFCEWFELNDIESDKRWRHSLEGRKLIKVLAVTMNSLKLFAETGALILPEKEKKEIKTGLRRQKIIRRRKLNYE